MRLSEKQRATSTPQLPLDSRVPTKILDVAAKIVPGAAIDIQETLCRGPWPSYDKFSQNEDFAKKGLGEILDALSDRFPGIISESGIKKHSRSKAKVEYEKGGNWRELTDHVRARIFPRSTTEISNMINFLCENYAQKIALVEDDIACGGKDKKIKLLFHIPEASGMTVELQVRHEGMRDVDKVTERLYTCKRHYEAVAENNWGNPCGMWDTLRTSKIVGKISKRREDIAQQKAHELGIDTLEISDSEKYYFALRTGEFNEPQRVLVMPDPYREGRPPIVITADLSSGLYLKNETILDRKLLDEAKEKGIVETLSQKLDAQEITRDQFVSTSYHNYTDHRLAMMEGDRDKLNPQITCTANLPC